MNELIGELQSLQDEMLDIVSTVRASDYQQQIHPDLSPIGWHLGHCVYTEEYWIKEQLLGMQTMSDSLKSIYVPELSQKQLRGAALPEKQELLEWAKNRQSENRDFLESVSNRKLSHHLLNNNYLFHFLMQHYSQHIETMMMILTEVQIQNFNSNYRPANSINVTQQKRECLAIETGAFNIGSPEIMFPYDNEQPEHIVQLNSFNIARSPVSNSEFLGFMEAGAYSIKTHWSEAGWKWCQTKQQTHPHHWQHNDSGDWFGIDHRGPHTLDAQDAVYGLNYFEAEAYAKWLGARLPHEYEWEAAIKNNPSLNSTLVWEWCKNTFHPYKGFSAYPYAGYSTPYFDKQHYVLKGGGRYTKAHIKRPGFRNYYLPDKRHIFAGLRLIYD